MSRTKNCGVCGESRRFFEARRTKKYGKYEIREEKEFNPELVKAPEIVIIQDGFNKFSQEGEELEKPPVIDEIPDDDPLPSHFAKENISA